MVRTDTDEDRLGHADHRHAAVERIEQMLAQTGTACVAQEDMAVDDDDGQLQVLFAQEAENARQLATIESAGGS